MPKTSPSQIHTAGASGHQILQVLMDELTPGGSTLMKPSSAGLHALPARTSDVLIAKKIE
jgi:hypothetical protein